MGNRSTTAEVSRHHQRRIQSRYHFDMPRRALESLEPDECLALLRQQSVGRLVYDDDHGPAAVPVIYALAAGDIVFRSEGGSKIEALRGKVVAFEVDQIDEATHAGWSVLVRGSNREIEFEDLPELLHHLEGGMPAPWKEGIHNIWVAITPKIVTGRRLADFVSEDFN